MVEIDSPLKQLFTAFQEKPIAYMRIYTKITGTLTAGVLLSQIVYWDKVAKEMGKEDFWHTDKEFMDETGMGLTELAGAKRKLKELGIVEIERKGTPATTHYLLDIDVLINLITSYEGTSQLDMIKPNNLIQGNLITNTTENTTKITTDIKKNISKENGKKSKYSYSFEDITYEDIQEIALRYKTTPGFVLLQKEQLKNYCESFGRRYKNYKAALRNFVIRDIKRNAQDKFDDKYRAIDARHIQ